MRIDNAKPVKIQSQTAFKGEIAQAKEEETSNGSGKILLALTGLAALGGGAYLLMRKSKGADDVKDVVKDAAKEIKDAAQEVINPPEVTAKDAEKVFTPARRYIAEHIQKMMPFVEKSEKPKLKNLAKTFIYNAYLPKEQQGKYPKLILIKGTDERSQSRISRHVPKLTYSWEINRFDNLTGKQRLDTFHSELEAFSSLPRQKNCIHILENADEVFEQLKQEAMPEIYAQEVDKMANAINQANEGNRATILFSAKDENALPEQLRAHIKDDYTINTKPFESPFALLMPRALITLQDTTDKFHGILEDSSQCKLINLAARFDDNAALPLFEREELYAERANLDFTKRKEKSLPSGFVIVGADQEKIAKTIALLPELTRSKLENLEGASTLPEVNSALAQKVKAAKEHHQKTGEITLIHIGDYGKIMRESLKETDQDTFRREFKAFLPHIQFSEKPKPYIVVLSTDYFHPMYNSNFLHCNPDGVLITKGFQQSWGKNSSNNPEKLRILDTLDDDLRKDEYRPDRHRNHLEYLTNDFARANENPFGEIINPSHDRHSRYLGIIGNKERNAKVIEQLPALLGANIVHEPITGKSDDEVIALIKTQTQKAEERFKETGKRTILNFGDVSGPETKYEYSHNRSEAYGELHHRIYYPKDDTKLIIVFSSESRTKMPSLFREYGCSPDSFLETKK